MRRSSLDVGLVVAMLLFGLAAPSTSSPISRSLTEFPFPLPPVALLNQTQLAGNFCVLDKDSDGDADLFAGAGGVFYVNNGAVPWLRAPSVMPRNVGAVDCGDANGDGRDDVVAYSGDAYLLGIQGAAGKFTWQSIVPFVNRDGFAGPRQIVLADVNQDTAADLLVINYTISGAQLSTYLGPTWTRAADYFIPGSNGYSRTDTTILTGPVQFGSACCDFLASHWYNTNQGFLQVAQLLLLHRTPTGSYQQSVLDPDVEPGRTANSAETFDEDQDGDMDFLVGYRVGRGGGIGYVQPPPSPVLFLYRNQGNGTFAREAWNTTYAHIVGIIAEPFQGNPTPQVMVIQSDRLQHFWKPNASWQTHSLPLPTWLAWSQFGHRPLDTAFDANLDGYLDVATEHQGQIHAFPANQSAPEPAPSSPAPKRSFPWLLVILVLVLLIVFAVVWSEQRRRDA